MRPGQLRRLRAEAEAAWAAELHSEVDRLLAIPDPVSRARAYEELTRHLAEGGDALLPADAERVRQSFAGRPLGGAASPSSTRPPPPATPITLATAEQYWREVANWALAEAEARGPALGVGDARARMEAASSKAALSDPALRARPAFMELHADRRAALAALNILGEAKSYVTEPEAVLPGLVDTPEDAARGVIALADAAQREALRQEGVPDQAPTVTEARLWWTKGAERRRALDWPALLLAAGGADDFADAVERVARYRRTRGEGYRRGEPIEAAGQEVQTFFGEAGNILRECGRVEALGGAEEVLAGSAVHDASALLRALERLRQTFEERQRAARRAKWLADQAAAERFIRMRRLAPFGAAAAALVPVLAVMWFRGWRPGGLLGVALDVFALPAVPVLACLGTAAVAGLAAWLTTWTRTNRGLWIGIGTAFAAGVASVVCAHALPVYRAREGAMMAGGHSLAGAVVRIEYADPAVPQPRGVKARGIVLWGGGQVRRGAVLEYTLSDPVRHLSGS
jgi:hypothetical protein